MKSDIDIPIFQHEIDERPGWAKQTWERIQKVLFGLASWVGAEEVARSIFYGTRNKLDFNTAINEISAKIASLRSMSSRDIDKLQGYIDQLNNLGFVLTGAALDNINKQKTKYNEKLANAKTRAEAMDIQLNNVADTVQSAKPTGTDTPTTGEKYKFEKAAQAANTYLEDLQNEYERQTKTTNA